MAVLSTTDRDDVVQKFIRAYFSGLIKVADLDTAEVRTLVNDLDVWLDANANAANAAITLAVRNKASNNTKFAAMAYVALKRGGVI